MSKYKLAMSIKTVTKDQLIEFLTEKAKAEVIEPPSTMYNLHNPAWADGYKEAMKQATIEACHLQEPEQPTFNGNQQIVFDYLKEKCNIYSFITYRPFEAILGLNRLDLEKTELRVKNAIDELAYKQQAQVLEVFASWALEQEESR